MLEGLKGLFGAFNPLQMLKPLLPTLRPQLTTSYKDYVASIIAKHGVELVNTDELKSEIAAFLVQRNGEPVIQWTVVNHVSYSGGWRTEVGQVLDVLTIDDMIAQTEILGDEMAKIDPDAMANMFHQFEEVPAPMTVVHQEEKPAPELLGPGPYSSGNDVLQNMVQTTEAYRKMPFCVAQNNGVAQLVKGPVDEKIAPFFGAETSEECLTWIEENKGLFPNS